MEFCPSFHQALLPPRQTPSNQFERVYAVNSDMLLIVRMEVRQVMRCFSLGEHSNDNPKKPAQFRHSSILAHSGNGVRTLECGSSLPLCSGAKRAQMSESGVKPRHSKARRSRAARCRPPALTQETTPYPLLIQEGNQAKLPSRAGAHRAVHVLNQGGRSAKGTQWDSRPPPTPS